MYEDRKSLAFSVNIEIDLVSVWLVVLYLISLYGSKLALLLRGDRKGPCCSVFSGIKLVFMPYVRLQL